MTQGSQSLVGSDCVVPFGTRLVGFKQGDDMMWCTLLKDHSSSCVRTEGSGQEQVAIKRLPRKLLHFQARDDGSLAQSHGKREAEKCIDSSYIWGQRDWGTPQRN